MRDAADTCITVCNMENFDPMGVHTGDSIVVAPSQTLSDKEYQMLRTASLKIIRALGIEGGCNVQFALEPEELRVLRDRGQPAGQPVVGAGLQGDRLPDRPGRGEDRRRPATWTRSRTPSPGRRWPASSRRSTTSSSKIPRWPFDKFALADRTVGTQMKATGEVMAIDRTFEAALMKAVRSLEIGAVLAAARRTPTWAHDGDRGVPRATPPTSGCSRSRRPSGAGMMVAGDRRALRHRPVVPAQDREHRRWTCEHGDAGRGQPKRLSRRAADARQADRLLRPR